MEARSTIVKAVQKAHFKSIIIGLKQKQKVNFRLVSQVGLYLDNHDVLRCKGRLQYTDLPYEVKFPILILKEHYLAALIVRYMHQKVLHGGVREALTQLRQTYWIPKGGICQKRAQKMRHLQKSRRTTLSLSQLSSISRA